MKTQLPAELGALYKDIVTGYTGVCISLTVNLTGSNSVLLQPKRIDEAGNPDKGQWLDALGVEKVGEGVTDQVKENIKAICLKAQKEAGLHVIEIDLSSNSNLKEVMRSVSGDIEKPVEMDVGDSMESFLEEIKNKYFGHGKS